MRYFLFLVFCFYLNGCSINEKNASIISVETLHNDTLTLDTHIDIPLTS